MRLHLQRCLRLLLALLLLGGAAIARDGAPALRDIAYSALPPEARQTIELIRRGGTRNTGCPGEAADEGGLFHGIFILRGVWLAIGDAEILEIDVGYCCEKGCSFEKKVTSLVTDFSTGAFSGHCGWGIFVSLMEARRRRMRPSSSNSQSSLP